MPQSSKSLLPQQIVYMCVCVFCWTGVREIGVCLKGTLLFLQFFYTTNFSFCGFFFCVLLVSSQVFCLLFFLLTSWSNIILLYHTIGRHTFVSRSGQARYDIIFLNKTLLRFVFSRSILQSRWPFLCIDGRRDRSVPRNPRLLSWCCGEGWVKKGHQSAGPKKYLDTICTCHTSAAKKYRHALVRFQLLVDTNGAVAAAFCLSVAGTAAVSTGSI